MSQDKFNTPWRLIANAIYSPAKDSKVFGTLDIDVTKADEYISEQRKSGNKITMTSVMTSAVALKLYYNEMYWAKMATLAMGIVFVYAIRRPLLRYAHDSISPWALRLTAISSLLIWFTVAASGRWNLA